MAGASAVAVRGAGRRTQNSSPLRTSRPRSPGGYGASGRSRSWDRWSWAGRSSGPASRPKGKAPSPHL
ncbi:hypothetical protein ACU635_40435 [[Actinomadura] parvosata]|uniref:hypothetical protein n=1 Tax=[Actinomadura] parvosata TaxID=1955412 RepID=UPI00406D478F